MAHRDAPVESFVRGDARRIVRQMELDHVAREQGSPVTQIEDGVPVEVAARVVEFDARRKLQPLVVRMVDSESVRPRQILPLDGDRFRLEAFLHLPQAAVGVRVRRRQPAHAAPARDFRQGRFGIPGGVFKEQVAAGQRDEIAVGTDAEGGFAAKNHHAVFVLAPGGDDLFAPLPPRSKTRSRLPPGCAGNPGTRDNSRARRNSAARNRSSYKRRGTSRQSANGSTLHGGGEQAHRVEIVLGRVRERFARPQTAGKRLDPGRRKEKRPRPVGTVDHFRRSRKPRPPAAGNRPGFAPSYPGRWPSRGCRSVPACGGENGPGSCKRRSTAAARPSETAR